MLALYYTQSLFSGTFYYFCHTKAAASVGEVLVFCSDHLGPSWRVFVTPDTMLCESTKLCSCDSNHQVNATAMATVQSSSVNSLGFGVNVNGIYPINHTKKRTTSCQQRFSHCCLRYVELSLVLMYWLIWQTSHLVTFMSDSPMFGMFPLVVLNLVTPT